MIKKNNKSEKAISYIKHMDKLLTMFDIFGVINGTYGIPSRGYGKSFRNKVDLMVQMYSHPKMKYTSYINVTPEIKKKIHKSQKVRNASWKKVLI